jgi:CRP-like cAMP-binding protein
MSSNRILSPLSRQDFALLEPHVEPVDLPVRKALETRRKRIDHIYFIEAGFASVVANGMTKPGIEVGIIGREGMTGLAIVLGGDRAQHATYVQVADKGMRIRADRLREADEQSITLHRALLRFVHSFLGQTTTTALANGRSKTEERLARWLLMADDRLDGNDLPLTHEFLGLMLGTHRRDNRSASTGKGGAHHHPPQPHHHPRSQSFGEKLERHLRPVRRLVCLRNCCRCCSAHQSFAWYRTVVSLVTNPHCERLS